PTSLLHWVRGMLTVRRRNPVLGTGDYAAVETDNESVLTFLRHGPNATVLVVANLASTARSATLRLPAHAGSTLTDVFGGAQFPPVGADGSLTLTMGARDFYWLAVTAS